MRRRPCESGGRRGATWLVAVVALLVIGCDGAKPEAPQIDRQPPVVVAVNPADDALGVQLESTVSIVFSEPVVIDTLDLSLVRVSAAGGEVAGTLSLPSAEVVIWAPDEPFGFGVDFEVEVAAGIADRAGNLSEAAFTWHFSTGYAFAEFGRVFTANRRSRDLTVFQLDGYVELPGSPVALGVEPLRLAADPGRGRLFVLYADGGQSGVLAVDATSLNIVADSGAVLPGVLPSGVVDLKVSPGGEVVLVAVPRPPAVHQLDPETLSALRPPLEFDRDDAAPVALAVSTRFDWVLVGLDGGARLVAYRRADMTLVPGFPVEVVPEIRGIVVDEERGKAWVAGSTRYAVVDLINLDRTMSFQIPVAPCEFCQTRLWRMWLSPAQDRMFLLHLRQALTTLVLSTLEPAPESPGGFSRRNVFFSDLIQNPRNGELLVLGSAAQETTVHRFHSVTLEPLGPALDVGSNAVDMELVP